MTDKSYVGLTRCFYCGEPNEILLDRRLRNTLERDLGIIDTEPCPSCAEYMEQGVIFLGIVPPANGQIPVVEFKDKRGKVISRVPNPQRTGHMAVISNEGFGRIRLAGILPENIVGFALKYRWMFVDVEAGRKLGIWE